MVRQHARGLGCGWRLQHVFLPCERSRLQAALGTLHARCCCMSADPRAHMRCAKTVDSSLQAAGEEQEEQTQCPGRVPRATAASSHTAGDSLCPGEGSMRQACRCPASACGGGRRIMQAGSRRGRSVAARALDAEGPDLAGYAGRCCALSKSAGALQQRRSHTQHPDQAAPCGHRLGVLQRYAQDGSAHVQQGAERADAAAVQTLGMQVDWPAAVLSCTILAAFFVTSTQRVLGLDRFLLSVVRQRKSERAAREQNEVDNARARLERLLGEDKPP